jgi:hypothetical protein
MVQPLNDVWTICFYGSAFTRYSRTILAPKYNCLWAKLYLDLV